MTTAQAREELAQYKGSGAPPTWEASKYAAQVNFYRSIQRLLKADGRIYKEFRAICHPPRPAHFHAEDIDCKLCYPYFLTHLDELGPGLYPAFKRAITMTPLRDEEPRPTAVKRRRCDGMAKA